MEVISFYEIGTTDDNEYPDDSFYSPVGCGRTFNSSTGDIVSPNFPKHYDNNMNCNYYIDVAPQSLVILTLVSFHLEGIFILSQKVMLTNKKSYIYSVGTGL